MATRRLAIGALAAAALLALAPLGAIPAMGQAGRADARSATSTARSAASATMTVTGTVKRIATTSLVLQEPKHRTITVYFASVTPLWSRYYGRNIFQKEIKVGHKLVVTGKYQGKNAVFAVVIEDTSIH